MSSLRNLVGITARKVEIKLDLPPSIEWQVLGGWSTEYKNGSLHISVGDMLSGKTQDIYIKLQIPAEVNKGELVMTAKVFSQGEPGQLYGDQTKLVLQYADQTDVEAAHEDKELMERYSVIELAESAAEALKLERKGQRDEANRMLNENINRNRQYLSAKEANNYQGMSNRMKQGMTEADRKRSHDESYRTRRNKESEEK